MGNYEEARRFNGKLHMFSVSVCIQLTVPIYIVALLLEREPTNQQAQSLNQLIEKGVAREGYIGMALMGGAAAVGSILLAGMMRRGRR